MACTKYDEAEQAAIVKAYFNYMISAEGQQTAARNAGSAPLSDSVRARRSSRPSTRSAAAKDRTTRVTVDVKSHDDKVTRLGPGRAAPRRPHFPGPRDRRRGA